MTDKDNTFSPNDFSKAVDEAEAEAQRRWEAMDPTDRLAAAVVVTKAYAKALREPMSFRYLIYEVMGFGPEAYVPLYCAGGMDINNAFPETNEEPGNAKLHRGDIALIEAATGKKIP